MSELQKASESIIKCLMIREKYMAIGLHTFPKTVARFLQSLESRRHSYSQQGSDDFQHEDRQTIEGRIPVKNHIQHFVRPTYIQVPLLFLMFLTPVVSTLSFLVLFLSVITWVVKLCLQICTYMYMYAFNHFIIKKSNLKCLH